MCVLAFSVTVDTKRSSALLSHSASSYSTVDNSSYSWMSILQIQYLFRRRNSKCRHDGPIAKIATGELNDKEDTLSVRHGVSNERYTAVVTLLRRGRCGNFKSTGASFERLNVSRITPRTFRVDAHASFINERIFRLPFLTACLPPFLSRRLILPTPSR